MNDQAVPHTQLVDDLVEFEEARLRANGRRYEESLAEQSRFRDLLIRSRDTGLGNREIAAILNRVKERLEEEEGHLPPLFNWSTRDIGKCLREADAEAQWEKDRLARDEQADATGDGQDQERS